MTKESAGRMPEEALKADSRANDIGRLIEEETEKRLAEMEKPDYEFPEQLKKSDWMLIAGICVISFVLILMCMTGMIA